MTYRRPSKYRAQRCELGSLKFDSQKEMRRWLELNILQRGGQISGLERQVSLPIVIDGSPLLMKSDRYKNGRKVTYRADFVYFENGQRIIEDTKGVMTSLAKLKIALVEHIYHTKIRIT